MSRSGRDRYEWRIILWVSLAAAVVSAIFGYAVAPDGAAPIASALAGVVNSVLITTPIIFLEVRSARLGVLRRLRRQPLVVYFSFKVVAYLVMIVGGLMVGRVISMALIGRPLAFDRIFVDSILFGVVLSVVGNLVFEVGRLLGFGTLRNLLTGRYVQPRSEQRAFLLIDMKDSTGLAERLGPVRFHELLNTFFRDIADAALDCDAEIHKYVGDEAILTWPHDSAPAECLACPFAAADRIAERAAHYRNRFGAVPTFRASLHRGEIVAGEIGDVRREIAFVGDTLNVAARLLEHAKTTGHDVLVSAEMLQRTPLPAELRADPLPDLTVRGRAAPLPIAALSRA